MRKPRIIVFDYPQAVSEYPADTCTVLGEVSAREGRGHSQWTITATLAADTWMEWGPAHGDEVVYVFDGGLEVDGTVCPPRGCIVIEAGVPARVRAASTTRILHCGSMEPVAPREGPLGPAVESGHAVRVVTEQASNPVRYAGPDGVVYDQRFYADSTSPTCRLALFGVTASGASVAAVHSHTQDEIIHVVRGELHVGRLVIGPGMSVAIQGEQRYGFSSPGMVEFLNYRRDASYVLLPPNPPRLETAAQMSAMGGVD